MTRARHLATFVLSAIAALSLGGCAYDYLQNTDRVGYSAGDAVKANLASETVNPTKASMYDKSGLGKNGNVMPKNTTTAPAAAP